MLLIFFHTIFCNVEYYTIMSNSKMSLTTPFMLIVSFILCHSITMRAIDIYEYAKTDSNTITTIHFVIIDITCLDN